tara:strand:- start:668 stop:2254 length:1587 start_codon:yes stop_codon:yes gene_type:complete
MKELAAKTYLSRSALVEALAIFGFFAVLLALSIVLDGFEHISEFSESHESWQLDEILTVLMIMPIALAFYAVRRLIELRREFRRRIAAEKEASSLAFHDPLTGLPNRRKAYQVITEAMRHADKERFALALIDLDRFKTINDQYGHIAGDEVLLAAAAILRAHVREGDLLARLGGDEFIVLIRQFASSDALVARVDEIMDAFSRTIRLPSVDSVISIGASVGVTLVDKAGVEIDRIISQADAAMYRAKESREPSFCFFEKGMDEAAAHRAKTERDLREAIRADRIEPFYQPVVELSTGQVLGYEALARWRGEDGNIRSPDEFIPIAEECGAIGDLYFRLLAKAAHEARHWPDRCFLAVNLSPLQFGDPWLVERTLQTLHLAGLPPGRLEVEITESALVAELETARTVIANFKSQGIKISLDDFGTGYASLRQLSELAFDKLKIDRSFITDIATDADSQTIVRAVTSMAHHLGLKVVVEGVETPESEDSVRAFGCDFGQGYLYGKPAPGAGTGTQNGTGNAHGPDVDEAA